MSTFFYSTIAWTHRGVRCAVGQALFAVSRRIGRLADRIDPPQRHDGYKPWPTYFDITNTLDD